MSVKLFREVRYWILLTALQPAEPNLEAEQIRQCSRHGRSSCRRCCNALPFPRSVKAHVGKTEQGKPGKPRFYAVPAPGWWLCPGKPLWPKQTQILWGLLTGLHHLILKRPCEVWWHAHPKTLKESPSDLPSKCASQHDTPAKILLTRR